MSKIAFETRVDMKTLDYEKTCDILNRIMQFELAGVVRYTHYALMITGPYRIPLVEFLKGQATESLQHAQQAGEILTGLSGHPAQKIAPISESHQHTIYDILSESFEHESAALSLYRELLEVSRDASVYIEEYARDLIGQEELHSLELKKMLRDFEPVEAHPV